MVMLGLSREQAFTAYEEHVRSLDAEFPHHGGIIAAASNAMRSEPWGAVRRVP